MLVQDQSALPDLQAAIGALRDAARRLEPDYLSTEEATSAVKCFAEGERLCAAGKTLAARRVERSGAWRAGGHRSVSHWIASATGVPVGQAVGTLQTARRLEHLPATEDAYRSGELAEARVKEVAQAAVANRKAEGELLEAARTETVSSLKERCRRAVAEGAIDETGSYERIRRGRYVRHWMDPDGPFACRQGSPPMTEPGSSSQRAPTSPRWPTWDGPSRPGSGPPCRSGTPPAWSRYAT
jgi:uncharacterized protein DUF222